MARGHKHEDEPGLSPTARGMRASMPYVDAVWKLLGGCAVGVVGGWALDRWLGTDGWLLVAGATVGIGVGFYAFMKAMLRLEKKK
jgi:ATP synthase protein I